MLKHTLQANFQGFKYIFKKPKLHNNKLHIYIQFKYNFIPLLIIVIFAYYNL
ncbi:phosphatase, partial [Francisella tularensis subsp. holarctica]|nr:phosphatase [Francisella tularensis subsp. holarctica]